MIKKYTADELCKQIVEWIETDIEKNEHDPIEWVIDLKEYLEGGPKWVE